MSTAADAAISIRITAPWVDGVRVGATFGVVAKVKSDFEIEKVFAAVGGKRFPLTFEEKVGFTGTVSTEGMDSGSFNLDGLGLAAVVGVVLNLVLVVWDREDASTPW